MQSSPPPALLLGSPPQPVWALDGFSAGTAAGDGLCFALEGEPLGASSLRETPRGLLSSTRLVGTVVSADDRGLRLAQDGIEVSLRAALPPGVSLAPLAGHQVRLRLDMLLERHRPATVDLSVRDGEGRLLLWARDGAVPSRGDDGSLAVRVSHGPDGRERFVVAAGREVSSVASGEVAELRGPSDDYLLVGLRIAGDDASFLLVRR